MIRVENLTKRYGMRTAVDDVSFEVDKGEILGFLGPNGAGKTTTMRILSGFLPSDAGRAIVAGFDVFEKPLESKRRVGYLPEIPPLYTEMRVDSYLRFVAKIKGVSSGDIPRRIAYLDEPTIGLDPKQIVEVRGLIKSLGGDHTVILSTHILPEVSVTCERVVIINNGRIVAVDTPGNLSNRFSGGQRIEVEVGATASTVKPALERISGVRRVTEEPTESGRHRLIVESDGAGEIRHLLSRAVFESGADLYQIRAESMSLEEVFVKLTTDEEEATA
ncbi:MAG: ATP-binding cassette domain-containing protein [Acidobacteriota bacterium]